MSDTNVTGRKNKGVQKSEALWLMSFSDMVLTMLCFFLLMISSMKPDKEKFKHIKEGMRKELIKEASIRNIAEKIDRVLTEKNLSKSAEITSNVDGLSIEFKDGLVFDPGSAEFRSNTYKTVQEIMKLISTAGRDYELQIEGHTDDAPLRGSKRFASNWELSAGRGFSIMRLLHSYGVAEGRISVIAYAHTRPKVAYSGLTGAQLLKARAANRRVVVLIK